MRISQYAYFSLSSETRDPDEINKLLGWNADFSVTRGSKRAQPPLPPHHYWEVRASHSSFPLDRQLRDLMDQLRPIAEPIRLLIDDRSCTATFGVVRTLNDPKGEEERLDSIETQFGTLERVPGQHQLLGWRLDSELLEFMRGLGAEVSIEEYG